MGKLWQKMMFCKRRAPSSPGSLVVAIPPLPKPSSPEELAERVQDRRTLETILRDTQTLLHVLMEKQLETAEQIARCERQQVRCHQRIQQINASLALDV